MPRKNKIETHANRLDIERAIIAGDSLRSIAERFHLGQATIIKHRDSKMVDQLKDAQEERHELSVENMADTVTRLFSTAQRFLRAAEKQLEDPDDPDSITWDPHAKDVTVIYHTWGDGKMVNHRESLQRLVDRLLKKEEDPAFLDNITYRYADPRREAARYIDSCRNLVETLAKLEGKIQDGMSSEKLRTVIFEVQTIIVEATKKSPEVGKQIADNLERLLPPNTP